MQNSSSPDGVHHRRHVRRQLKYLSDKTRYAEDKTLKVVVQQLIALIAKEFT
jgi:hypothetical protein